MGCGRWSTGDWSRYAHAAAHRTRAEMFAPMLDAYLDPRLVRLRESRDSAHNPESNAIVVALDVTGSMGMLAEFMAKQALGTFVSQVLDRRPVSDPHLMFMGIGDANCDQAPLQVTQFEADLRIVDQLTRLWLEGGGGGNSFESYDLAWYFAATRTAIDCHAKRGRKGILFTIGDEEPPPGLRAEQLSRVLGGRMQHDIDARSCLDLVSASYDVFHVVVEEGSYARSARHRVMRGWTDLLGQQRVVPLADHRRLAEVLVSTIEVHAGRNPGDVAASWSRGVDDVVAHAVMRLAAPPLSLPVSRLDR